jgi:phospholipid/cholesterol/gamma-HCH transport system substrate-binding protein
MPRTRSLAWSELKLGVWSIVAVVIAVTTIMMLTGAKGFFWQQYHLKARFTNVAGLTPGSPVRLAGIEKGIVEGWDFIGESVDVTLKVNKDVRDRITTASVATLGSISLLGEATVDITPSSRGTPIPEWGYVPEGHTPSQISDVTDQAGQSLQQVSALVDDVRHGKGTVGKLMTDDQLYGELHRFVTTANGLVDGIKQGRGSVGKLLNDKQTADRLDASLKNIQTLTEQLNSGQGSLGKLLKDDAFARSLSTTTDDLDALVGKVNRGEGTAGKLMADPELYNRMNDVTNRLGQMLTRLEQGEGTAGQLLKDRQLYENMNKVTTELAGLITAIKKDPKKYLNVKVSIF